ncbi:dihydrolipoyl dehydrogenase [Niallia oryzisoli]|uniref:dihydrolipoyl dehydrogenase n=1 Tax=Niallia oryzisoli TaxID=1737571 RepID=UPI003735AB88
MSKKYDLVIVGGGPGGYVAALHAAKNGQKVALIEADHLGGTCLNRGCIPSKTLLRHTEIIESIQEAKEWGIETGELRLSLDKMRKRKDDVINKLRSGIAFLMKQDKVDVFNGLGIIESSNAVKVVGQDSEELLEAGKIIIATGSTPVVPPIPGLDSVSFETSDSIFDIKEIPESIAIIGGGVIGVEFATIFASLNSRVTIIEMADRLAPLEDVEASKLLEKTLKKKGIKILTSTKVERFEKAGEKVATVCTDKKGKEVVVESSTLIVSVGRKPNLSATSKLNLEMAGPFIKVNNKMETSIPNVYAVGDVVGGFQLAHVASAEGIVAANNASGELDKIDYHVVPRCIYTLPEIASVGLSEADAKAKGLNVRTEKFDHAGNGKSLAAGDTTGFTKIVYDEKLGEIIGVTMVGQHVTEMISEASAFMYLEGTVEEAAKMIHPHPSVVESFYEAAQNIVHKLKKEKKLVR